MTSRILSTSKKRRNLEVFESAPH